MANSMMEMRVRVEGGYLVATPSYDDNYPGIDVEFQPDEKIGEDVLSLPRVLMEKPAGKPVNTRYVGFAPIKTPFTIRGVYDAFRG